MITVKLSKSTKITQDIRPKVVTHLNPPTKCDHCKTPIESVFYDAKTKMGPWGNLCQSCFNQFGIGLGTGRGQKYARQHCTCKQINPKDKSCERCAGTGLGKFIKIEG